MSFDNEFYDQRLWEKVKEVTNGEAKRIIAETNISKAQVYRFLDDDGLGNIQPGTRDKLLSLLEYESFEDYKAEIDKELDTYLTGMDNDNGDVAFRSAFHKNLPAAPEYFWGRKPLLWKIHRRLADKTAANNVLLLCSMGGMGKTTLLHKYLNLGVCKATFNYIVYISVHKNLESAFIQGMGTALGIDTTMLFTKERPLDAIIQAMQQVDGQNLVAIDNINECDYEDLIKLYKELRKCGWKVLITTRTKPDNIPCEEVPELAMEDALLLFMYFYLPQKEKRDDKHLQAYLRNHERKQDFIDLLNHIDRHTLFTELLAKTGNKGGISPGELLEHLKAEDIKAAKLDRTIYIGTHPDHTQNEHKKATLHQYMLSIFDTHYLEKETTDAHKAADNKAQIIMLHFFSVLPAVEIPVAHLQVLWRVKEDNSNEFRDRLDHLMQTGWIKEEQSYKKNEWSLTYKMHHLIQEVVFDKLKPTTRTCAPLVTTMTEMMVESRKEMQADHLVYQDYFAIVMKKFKDLKTSEN